jgi:Kef-type K+ transport system membrane component KefB
VIAEVIGGILLGPSVMGRIPGFTNAIFPKAALPLLSLTANLGLILFLFLIALEMDMRIFRTNWKIAVSVSAAGMVLPFGLGCAVAYGLYHQFGNEPGIVKTSLGVYMLFVGVAMAITAFPVLCRILLELKLLHTPVGVIVLAAGVGNDVVGWILLALAVALVNASSGITALYALLCCVAWVLFLVFAVRPAYMWYLRRTDSIEKGPTQSVVALTLLMVLGSAFFTAIVGVHPIFGGFLIGLICPHESGFAVKLTEKIEDFVSVLFLPLYFAYSGLGTNLGLLNSGITWAYVVAITAIAFIAKIAGGTLAARANKLLWRESFAVGGLMSCKGLIELIVLNIGLNAKILSTRTFTMFVVMALLTTFATTPLTMSLYPPEYQRRVEKWRRGETDWDGNKLNDLEDRDSSDSSSSGKPLSNSFTKLMVLLRLDSLSSLCVLLRLLGNETQDSVEKVHRLKATHSPETIGKTNNLSVHGLRLVPLTERQSSMILISESEDNSRYDPVLNVFRAIGQINDISVSGSVIGAPSDAFADTLLTESHDRKSELTIIPWDDSRELTEGGTNVEKAERKLSSKAEHQLVSKILESSRGNIAIFVSKGFGGSWANTSPGPRLTRAISSLSMRSNVDHPTGQRVDCSHHIFLPFIGGEDDRVALYFVLQMAQNPKVTATIVQFKTGSPAPPATTGAVTSTLENPSKKSSITTRIKKILPKYSEKQETLSNAAATAEPIPSDSDGAFFASISDSLPASLLSRVVFETIETTSNEQLQAILSKATTEIGLTQNLGDIVVVGRHSRLLGLADEVPQSSGSAEVHNTLGGLAERVLSGGLRTSVLVIQAGSSKKND